MNRVGQIWRSAGILLSLAAVCAAAFALESGRTIATFAQIPLTLKVSASKENPAVNQTGSRHSALAPSTESGSHQIVQESWMVQQGAPEHIVSLTQTTDGFLWLGGPSGLFRFDGTRFERFHAAFGDQLLSTDLISVFATTTAGLWVGYEYGGFSFVKDGQVTNYSTESGADTGTINGFAQSPDGVVWAGTSTGVWRFEDSRWKRLGPEWNGPNEVTQLGFDRSGTLWALSGYSKRTLVFMLPGVKRFQVADEDPIGSGFTEDADQVVVTSPIARPRTPSPSSNPKEGLHAFPIFRKDSQQIVDRSQGVWIMSRDQVLLTHIGASKQLGDALSKASTGDSETYEIDPYSQGALVDHEGNIWFCDRKGVHRFFYAPFVRQNLPVVSEPSAIAADDNGGMWVGAWDASSPGLYHVANGKIAAHLLANSDQWTLAYRAIDNTIWFGGANGLWHLVDGKIVQIALPKEILGDGIELQAMTADRAGGLWIFFSGLGLYRLANGVWTIQDGRGGLPTKGVISEFTDSVGRVWFGCVKNRLAFLEGDRLYIFGSNDGIRVGTITAIYGRGPQIWIGGELGLQQFDNGHFRTIIAADDDWLLGLSGIVETANGDLWLNGLSGIFHISRAELSLALEDPSYRVKGEHFGNREGLPGFATQIRPLPSAVEGSDGALWFSVSGGLVRLDPTRPQPNVIAPPVTIESVSADDKNYAPISPLTFPVHTSNVRIEYAAISLSDPAAVRFRVRLQETETDWHEVSTASPVMYRNLPPGHYHFSVAASDTNGVWSDKVAGLDFTILPAWYQTNWFRIACAATFLLLLWFVYQLRLRQLHHQFSIGLEARVNERTRIARDLHDTLLQSFHGLLLRLQTASHLLPTRPDEAKKTLDSTIEQASQAITEGRDAVQSLRSSTVVTNDLAVAIRTFAEGLAAAETSRTAPFVDVAVEGTPRELHPIVRDEAYRIVVEVLRNAFQHAQANRVEVEIRYGAHQLRLRVRDDGKGIDASLLRGEGPAGHFGLHGIRERAQLVGGNVDLWSNVGSGTEVELTIPAPTAYGAGRTRRSSSFSEKEE